MYDGIAFRGAGLGAFYQTLNEDRARSRYYFGKYFYESWSAFAKQIQDESRRSLKPMDPLAIEFFHLEHALTLLELLSDLEFPDGDARLVLTHLMDAVDERYLREDWKVKGLRFDSAQFFQLVQACISEREYPEFIERALLVDPGPHLTQEDHFILDGHINDSGHRKVAELLGKSISSGRNEFEPTSILTSEDGRAAFHIGESPEGLPDQAYASKLDCAPPLLKVPFGVKSAHIDVRIENQSDHWWPSSRGELKGMIRLRPILLDEAGAILDDNYQNGITPLPHPLGPHETTVLRVHLDPDALPPFDCQIEFDLAQEYVAWFKDKGGRTARVKVIRE
jgi:hypothetical protein